MKTAIPIFLLALTAAALAAGPATAPLTFSPADSPKPPFTLAKDTTVLTSPLNADGTVDYLAALNRRFYVKPQDNAFATWIDLLPPTQLAGDIGQSVDWMTGHGYPDARKSWEPIETFLKRTEHLSDDAAEAAFENLNTAAKRPWKPADFPYVDEFLAARKDSLDLAVAASQMPAWWAPTISTNQRTVSAVVIIGLSSVREISRALAARATLRAASGNFNGFLSDVAAIKRLAAMQSRQFVIGEIVALGLDMQADQAITAAAASGQWSAHQCSQVAALLAQFPPPAHMPELFDLFERYNDLDAVAVTATGNARLLTGPDGDTGADCLLNIDPAQVDWDTVLRAVNGSVDEQVRILRIADPAALHAAADAREKRVEKNSPAGEQLPAWLILRKKVTESREQYTARVAAAFENIFCDQSLANFADAERRGIICDQLTQLLTAAARFHARTGHWPADAGALVPNDLPAIPRDFVNQPFTLRLAPNGPSASAAIADNRTLQLGAPP
ncbi:MAG TPA: hypothetical protein VHQ47_02940 [Phycisphaerae bacterium]|nr:hypothetical protein [Phycisphaerae bacterium]